MCDVCAQTLTRANEDAWTAIEEERATFLPWAAGEARSALSRISGVATEAFERGIMPSDGEAMAVAAAEEMRDDYAELLRTIYLRVMPHFGNKVYEQFAEGSRSFSYLTRRGELTEDFWAEVVDRFIRERAGDLISGMLRKHVSVIRAVIAEGVAEGEGVEEIARRLREQLPGVDRARARRISRTEVIRASNFGSIEGARATGLDMRKEWIATPDTRTRPSHAAADGQQVGLDAAFTVGGHEAQYPGDPALPAEESVSCRCTVAFVVADEERGLRLVISAFSPVRMAA